MSEIVSIQVGKIQHLGPEHGYSQVWTTATFKEPVTGPLWLGREGFVGDHQADRRVHGGPDKAALVYSQDHFTAWQAEVFDAPLPPGAFGENILVRGWTERDVCIGDVFQAGGAKVELSHPRQPCSKQARRWGIPDLVRRMAETGRSGWYLRVLEEGEVQAGQHFKLLERRHPEWTVHRAMRVLLFERDDLDTLEELGRLPELSESWREDIPARLKDVRERKARLQHS